MVTVILNRRSNSWAWLLLLGSLWVAMGCPGQSGRPHVAPDEMAESQPDGPSDGGDSAGSESGNEVTSDVSLFSEITGSEILIEGTRFESGNGATSRRDERFTSTFSITRLDARDCGDVFVGDQLLPTVCGNLEGQAHLTYSETGADIDPSAECPTTSYAGQVEWDVTLQGTYDITPFITDDGIVR